MFKMKYIAFFLILFVCVRPAASAYTYTASYTYVAPSFHMENIGVCPSAVCRFIAPSFRAVFDGSPIQFSWSWESCVTSEKYLSGTVNSGFSIPASCSYSIINTLTSHPNGESKHIRVSPVCEQSYYHATFPAQVVTHTFTIQCPDNVERVLPSCSDFLSISDERCIGGQGLWLAGTETELDTILAKFSNPQSIRTPISAKSDTLSRPDSSKCKLGTNSGVISQAIYCPLGFTEEFVSSSSSDDSPSSSSSEHSSSSAESSSSSEEELSSSSSDEHSSSSEAQDSSSSSENSKNCYIDNMSAWLEIANMKDECWASGGDPDFYADENFCIKGECIQWHEISSSSEGGSSSSHYDGYGDGGGQCLATSSKLLKDSDDYGSDWVYMGKKIYDKKVTEFKDIRYPGKYFDISGRVYSGEKPPVRHFYYIDGNKIYKPRTVEEYLEFEVWLGTIKDSDGSVRQIFSMEDKANKLRRDSTVYSDGEWRVFEINNISMETKEITSWGTKVLLKYDDNKRLTENYYTDEKGDTLVSKQYIWKNGKLVKTIINGLEREFIYGKKSTDTVRVVPPDDYMFLHSGYNGTAGVIPEEGDSTYKFFAIAPYAYYPRAEEESQNLISPLLKESVNSSCVTTSRKDIELKCLRYDKMNFDTTKILQPFPGENYAPTYGWSSGIPIFEFKCKCDSDGYFYFEYNDNLQSKLIKVMESNWHFTVGGWKEYCWSKSDMQNTYYHELKHIENNETVTKNLFKELMIKEKAKNIYDMKTEKDCKEVGDGLIIIMTKEWNAWSIKEESHNNTEPKSPIPSKLRDEKDAVACPVN